MVVSYSPILFSRQQPTPPRPTTEPKFSMVAPTRDRAEFLIDRASRDRTAALRQFRGDYR